MSRFARDDKREAGRSDRLHGPLFFQRSVSGPKPGVSAHEPDRRQADRLHGFRTSRHHAPRTLPPFADTIMRTSASVTRGSSPSVCPLSIRTTSATTRPPAQPG
jgi:hypothetical protein